MKSWRIFPGQHIISRVPLPRAHLFLSRFILNLPDEELASLERVCFQVEQAYVPVFVRTRPFLTPRSHIHQTLVLRGFHPGTR